MQKILIVDDKEQNLFTLKKVLADLDVEFVQATHGNDALKATLYNDFALAILDVQMPDIDGYELAELLRCDLKTENLPIIFLSAVYHDDYHVFKGYDSGAVDFIIKPYEPKILLSKVNF
ncbi:MAG: response regulator, partial [Candidatus Electrothrix sp. ATG1]|nr:response regulator [Candidatus Electrothrix sp. ATG1]